MADSKEKMISDEQKIVNHLLDDIEKEIGKASERFEEILYFARTSMNHSNTDDYADIVNNQNEKKWVKDKLAHAKSAKNELYEHRMILEVEDEDGTKEEIEMKIGLEEYGTKGDRIYLWTMPVCNHFILNPDSTNFASKVNFKGETSNTKYTLKMKRKVDLHFSKVKDVIHLFPLTKAEAEKIVSDEFLQELLKRRSNTHFKNIVFSIQKRQGQIIQSPFEKNLIVQGCAGSGKSMIMLHRLPIILFNYPKRINRNDLYIITPSKAYIQMAENMRRELKISDINMGTLEDYYNHLLGKYGIRKPEELYGPIISAKKLSMENESYVYSRQCIEDIKEEADRLIRTEMTDLGPILSQFGFEKNKFSGTTDREELNAHVLDLSVIVNANIKVLRKHHKAFSVAMKAMDDIDGMFTGRKIAVERRISQVVHNANKAIENANMELENLDEEQNAQAILNRRNTITQNTMKIQEANEARLLLAESNKYFETLLEQHNKIEKLRTLLGSFKPYEESTTEDLYDLIDCERLVVNFYENIVEFIDGDFEEQFLAYTDSISDQLRSSRGVIFALEKTDDNYVSRDVYYEIEQKSEYYNRLSKELPNDVYEKILDKIGIKKTKKLKLPSAAGYIYTQIMFCINGVPNVSNDSLITIDEAQGLAPLEFELIRDVNASKAIFNLFGDERQHIEGTKGIESWNEIGNIVKFNREDMNENYRNASQITDYCNDRFGMNMNPINLPGRGVHELFSEEEYKESLKELFVNPPKTGLLAIVVKNSLEAKNIIRTFKLYERKLHDMTGDNYDIHRTRWNVITVEQAKGLEFGTVVALSGHMTENEKYISYTRALEELYVYDKEIFIPDSLIKELESEEKDKEDVDESKTEKSDSRRSNRKEKKTKDFSNSRVRAFFEESGLKVVDTRPDGGNYIWVVGERAEIEPIVSEAIKKFGLTGAYGIGKVINNRNGWYTKTKK